MRPSEPEPAVDFTANGPVTAVIACDRTPYSEKPEAWNMRRAFGIATVLGLAGIFLTRTRGPFRSTRPAPILLWGAIGAKLPAPPAAVYGFFMVSITWNRLASIPRNTLGWARSILCVSQ